LQNDSSPDGSRGRSSLDEQFGASGVGGIGGEVEGCCGDFGCGADAAERNAALGPSMKLSF
jgi:hypothetical protein